MKKLLCIVFISSILFSEESGMFFGLGIGGGFNTSGYMKYNDIATDTIKGHGFDAEFIFGYKQFFIQNVGLRYYLNIDYSPGIDLRSDSEAELRDIINSSSLSQEAKQDLMDSIKPHKVDIFNAGLNIDLLFNFVVSDNMDIGLYGGGQIGFNTLSGSLAKSVHDAYEEIINKSFNYRVKAATIDFSTSINFGLRASFFKNNAMELFAKIPMLENNLFHYESTVGNKDETSIYFKQPYIVGIRYVFSF